MRLTVTIAATSLLALTTANLAPAQDAQPLMPYAGKVPFKCEVQDAGHDATGPRPGKDPYCVEFDKTNQNVSELGIFDFLAGEPERVSAAGPKCFYFQRDHWTGSIVQGSDPELYHWDGNYFFDKARATGGVNVANFAIGGTPMDASPYAPPEFDPYLEEGGGGNIFAAAGIEADPACAARVDTAKERRATYRRWYRRALRGA